MLTKLEAFALWEPYFPNDKLMVWGDCVLIAQKPHDFDALEFSARYRGVQRSLGPVGDIPALERGDKSRLSEGFDPKKCQSGLGSSKTIRGPATLSRLEVLQANTRVIDEARQVFEEAKVLLSILRGRKAEPKLTSSGFPSGRVAQGIFYNPP
jgi:hypothetical protein